MGTQSEKGPAVTEQRPAQGTLPWRSPGTAGNPASQEGQGGSASRAFSGSATLPTPHSRTSVLSTDREYFSVGWGILSQDKIDPQGQSKSGNTPRPGGVLELVTGFWGASGPTERCPGSSAPSGLCILPLPPY